MPEQLLKRSHLKVTPHRLEVLHALQGSRVPLCARQILQKCSGADSSTVYRILSALVQKHIIGKTVDINGVAFYHLLREAQHSHQLVCSRCHEQIAIDECPIHELSSRLSAQTGYIITSHHLELTGLCPSCAETCLMEDKSV